MGPSEFVTGTRSTVSSLLGGVDGLFGQVGPSFHAEMVFDDDAHLPAGSRLLVAGSSVDAVLRLAPVGGDARVRTACLKFADLYGPGQDQDLLLASSADGIPFHHAALPARRLDDRLYSSLWLYLAGVRPVVFGLRAEKPGGGREVGEVGDRFRLLLSGALTRFREVGTLTLTGVALGDALQFAATNTGGGLRALPPAVFYRG
jgi:hypothetical protein